MKRTLNTTLQVAIAGCFLAVGFQASAEDIAKANNATALNVTTSWSNNVVPGASDRMLFTNNITGTSLAAALGASLSVNGILYGVTPAGVISSPAAVTIGATTGSTLTIGSGGITNASTNLTLSCAVALGAAQTWGVATNRTVTMGGVVSGLPTTNLTIRGPGLVILSGANTFSGNLVVDGLGEIRLNNAGALGNSTSVTLNAGGGAAGSTSGNKLGLNGFSTPAATTITMIASNVPTDMRSTIYTTAGNNVVNGPIVLQGNNSCQFNCNNTAHTLVINGSVTASPSFTGLMFVRGAGPIVINSPNINLGPTGRFSRTDGGVATITTSGHTWASTEILTGTLKLGINNALPTDRSFSMGQSGGSPIFDLAGYNQTLTNLTVAAVLTTPRGAYIYNSSTTADSVLTFQSANASTFNGTLLDSGLGGTRKLGLSVAGGGFLTLTSTNAYSGPTTITGAGSRLVVSTIQTGGGSFAAGDGTTLGVAVPTAGTTLRASSVTLGGGTAATNLFNFGSGNPLTPAIYATNLTASGTVYVNVTGAGLALGQCPLIKYGSATGVSGGTFVANTLPAGVLGYISNNVANSSIDLVITLAPLTLWTGATNDGSGLVFAGQWDINATTNWVDGQTMISKVYTDGLAVQFDDSAPGTNLVSLAANVAPGSVTVTNAGKDYTLAGTFGITGAGRFTKDGSGRVTVATTNAYSGDTIINAGTFQLGSTNAVPDGAGKGNMVLSGTFDLAGFNETINGLNGSGAINNSAATAATLTLGGDNQSGVFTGAIGNNGALGLTKTGAGNITLSGYNAFSGPLTVSGGILTLNGPASPTGSLTLAGTLRTISNITNSGPVAVSGASTLNVDTGTTLQLGGLWTGAQSLTKIGGGTLVITNSGTFGSLFPQNGSVVLANNATITNSAFVSVGRIAGDDATLYVKDTASTSVNSDFNVSDTLNSIGRLYVQDSGKLFLKNLWLGKSATSQGYLYQSGGIVTNAWAASSDWQIGGNAATAAGSFGGYYLSGGRLDVRANFQVGAYGTGEMIVSGGQASVWTGFPVIGRYTNGFGLLVIKGGAFNQYSANNLIIGEGGTGTLVVSNTGALFCTNTLYLSSSNASPGTGTVLLATGGIITTPKVSRLNPGGKGTFIFDGGTLQAGASSFTFMQNIDTASILNGGAILDSAGFSIVIAQPLLAGGTGGVTKASSGTVSLAGTNTFTGPAKINAGKLAFATFHAGGGTITVANSASLGVDVGAADTSLNSARVSLGAGSAVDYNFGTFGNPSVAPLRATNLALNGTVTINVLAGNLAVGNIKLITFDNPITGAGNFVLGTLPKGVVANPLLVTNGNTIELVVTYVSTLTWAGTINADWDIGVTTNWVLDSVSSAYAQDTILGDAVRFDDSITTGLTNVNLATNVSPFSITVSNALFNYTLNGTNKITGPTAITKAGAGSLRINTTNDFTGAIKITGGTLIAGCTNSLGATNGSVNVSGAGTLDVNGLNLGFKPIVASGAGVGGNGAIFNSGAGQNNALNVMTLTGDTTFGGSGRWDLRINGTAQAALNTLGQPYKITKVGTNQVSLVSVTVDPALGDIDVVGGIFGFEANTTSLGNPAYKLTVFPNASLQFWGATNVLNKPLVLNGGTNASIINGSGANTAVSPSTLNASSILNVGGTSLALNGPIGETAPSSLTKIGSGTLTLGGANSYSGGSTVNNGIVVVNTGTSLGSGPVNLFTNTTGVTACRIQLAASVTVTNTLMLPANSCGTSGRGVLEATGTSAPTWAGPIDIYGAPAAGGMFYSDATAVLTLAGPITVYGSVIPSQRDGNVVYAGGGSYTNFNLSGAGKIGVDNGMATNAALTIGVSANAVLNLNGFNQTLAGLLKSGNTALVTNSSATQSVLTIGRDTDNAFSGLVAGNLALVKDNTNALTLSGANTYSGPTTIKRGTLLVSGVTSGTGTVTVQNGGTLGGTGTLGGAVAVESGGTLAPGASIGTLTIGGALTLVSGATAAMELGDSLAADKAAASGAVTYAGKLKLTWTGGTMTVGGPYTLFAGSSFSGAFTALELVNWPDSTKRVNLANLTTDGTISLIANTAPTALGLSLPVEKNLAASFTLAKYAQDAEGDPLVTTFSTPSHGAVALAGGIVTYTPTTGYTGPDSYTYTVTDPYGASATATVAVTVSGPSGNGANIVSVTVAVPTATVKALGIPGATYSLQYIDDLATDTWHDLSGTATAATTGPNIGQFILTDSSAPATGRFYRTKYVSGP